MKLVDSEYETLKKFYDVVSSIYPGLCLGKRKNKLDFDKKTKNMDIFGKMLNSVTSTSLFIHGKEEAISLQMTMYLALMSNYRISKTPFENYDVKYVRLKSFVDDVKIRKYEEEEDGC